MNRDVVGVEKSEGGGGEVHEQTKAEEGGYEDCHIEDMKYCVLVSGWAPSANE